MPAPKPTYRNCTEAKLPASLKSGTWRHLRSRLLATAAKPRHFAQDVIATPGNNVVLKAKFSYGFFSKDLEDENVHLWVANSSDTYEFVGETTTDNDGRIQFEIPGEKIPEIGVYSVYYRVPADESSILGELRVLPEGTKFIVFDIDETISSGGTLTTTWNFLTGRVKERPRRAAVQTARRRFEQGYQLVYLTARPYVVTEHTRRWLARFGFPPGTLQLVQDTSETIASVEGRARYKQRYLQSLLDRGYKIEKAYGNARSDIAAYRGIGLDPEDIFIVGEHGGKKGTVALDETFESHLAAIEKQPPVEQPYTHVPR